MHFPQPAKTDSRNSGKLCLKPMPQADPIAGYKTFAQKTAASSLVIIQELI